VGDAEAAGRHHLINALGTEVDLFLDRPYNSGGRAFIEWNTPGVPSAVGLYGTLE
jgi:hypothetical protein